MFVTQKEIETRLTSDINLLTSLLKDSQEVLDNSEQKESLNNSNDSNSANVNTSIPIEGELVSNTDTRLSRIVDEARQEQGTRDNDRGVGRPRDAINRSTEQRADIALMGEVLGHGLAADLLGISTASSSLHSRGLVNAGDDVDVDLNKSVKRKLNSIRNKSADGIIQILDSLDSNKMLETIKTPKDAVYVAGALAGIIQKVQPKEEDIKPTAQFVIIQPVVKTIEQYEVINV